MDRTKEMAWNGVRLRVPTAWEISRMGRRYLQLEDDDGPVFELKWQFVKGRFSHAAHLKKLAARRWFGKSARVAACDLPAGWSEALASFRVQAFKWQGLNLEGLGAILYCGHCRTAHLLQFLRSDVVDEVRLCNNLLASLSDHPQPQHNGNQRWAIYDLRADIPRAFRLRQYRFDAGAFALEFDAADRSTLSLRRWGPASLALAQQTLGQFVAGQLPWVDDTTGGSMVQEGNFVHMESACPSDSWPHWARRLRRRPVFHWMHAWHDRDHNRILAVDAHGPVPLPRQVLQQVSDRYVMV